MYKFGGFAKKGKMVTKKNVHYKGKEVLIWLNFVIINLCYINVNTLPDVRCAINLHIIRHSPIDFLMPDSKDGYSKWRGFCEAIERLFEKGARFTEKCPCNICRMFLITTAEGYTS